MKGNWIKGAVAVLIVCFVFLLLAGLVSIARLLRAPETVSDIALIGVLIALPGALLLAFAAGSMVWSFKIMFLSLIRDGSLDLGLLTYGFKDEYRIDWGGRFNFLLLGASLFALLFWGVALTASVTGITVAALTICLVVWRFCINKYIICSQFDYVIYDDDDISVSSARGRSAELMRGHKFQYFVIMLILITCTVVVGIITLGIGLLFALPYCAMVKAHFYESLVDEEDSDEEHPEGDSEGNNH